VAPDQRIDDLPTPCLILDRRILTTNIDRMGRRVRELGIRLRPHVKTPKSIDVVRLVLDDNVEGIAVSTLREATYFFENGITDIFYAVALAPGKIPAVAELLRRGADLTTLVDCRQAAEIAAAAAAREKITLPVIVEVDVDHHRSGIENTDPDFLPLCRLLHESEAIDFRGIMTYGGAAYDCPTTDAMADVTETHRQVALETVGMLAKEGIGCRIVSYGSSPATFHARTMEGFTETRCGTFILQDLVQSGIGSCEVTDIALTVLASVISHQPGRNRLFIDAGGLALSKDRSTRGRPFDAGYGLVCDTATGKILDELFVATTSQELGVITTRSGASLDFDAFPIGRKIRILPNHADMTAAAYEEYHVVDGSDVVVARWPRVNRW
jgi:D-serine deaminase-like pyridoxal phosphate-dependent protein